MIIPLSEKDITAPIEMVVGLYIRVGPRKVNLIGATCSLTPMWVMVIECLWNTFWPDPSKDLRFRRL